MATARCVCGTGAEREHAPAQAAFRGRSTPARSCRPQRRPHRTRPRPVWLTAWQQARGRAPRRSRVQRVPRRAHPRSTSSAERRSPSARSNSASMLSGRRDPCLAPHHVGHNSGGEVPSWGPRAPLGALRQWRSGYAPATAPMRSRSAARAPRASPSCFSGLRCNRQKLVSRGGAVRSGSRSSPARYKL